VNGALAVRLPVELMRPKAVEAIPGGQGWHHSIKVDGWRVAVIVTDEGVLMHSRRGRDLSHQFPEIVDASSPLSPGTVIDGEVVVWDEEARRFDFEAVQRRGLAKHPRPGAPQAVLVAFDLLALPHRDLRGSGLVTRWAELGEVVEAAGPRIQRVTATDDPGQAETWMRQMRPLAVEGIVSKRWHAPYRPREPRARWFKVRTSDTVDATVLGLVGPPRRPWAAVVRLPDGQRAVTSPRLDPVAAVQLGRAVAGEVLAPVRDPELDVEWSPLREPLLAEVRVRSGRQALVRYVRLRAEV
jgi:ATP-dependent DNA ligase